MGKLNINKFNSDVSIISVNWNSGPMLKDCVDSVLSFKDSYVAELIVVDNGSKDNSLNNIPNDPLIRVVKVFENLGFGRACNLGANGVKSKYLLFINPDACLYANSLKLSLSYMDDPHNADVGICGVQLLDETGFVSRSCARFPTPWGFAVHSFGLDKLFPSIGHFMSEWAHDSTQDVDQLIGAFFLVRRDLFKELDGFDERFFVYFEEVDFSYRAKKAGWRSVYLADVQAFHAGGGTSNQVKAKRLFYSLRSRLLYAFKHFTLPGALLVLMATLLLEPISRSALAIGRRSLSSLAETWSGYGMLFRWLPQWWFKGITR